MNRPDAEALRRAIRLYAITPDTFTRPEHYAAAVGVAVQAGVRVVQYRDKRERPRAEKLATARLITDLCRRTDALCIINDDPELAAEAGAHGVHLGPNDSEAAEVKSSFPQLLVGGSAGGVEAAEALVAAGVDYLGVGAIFDARPTKSNASAPRGTGVLRELRAHPSLAEIPIVAIGGITVDNARSCLDAGADGVAAIRAILGARDIAAAIHSFDAALSNR